MKSTFCLDWAAKQSLWNWIPSQLQTGSRIRGHSPGTGVHTPARPHSPSRVAQNSSGTHSLLLKQGSPGIGSSPASSPWPSPFSLRGLGAGSAAESGGTSQPALRASRAHEPQHSTDATGFEHLKKDLHITHLHRRDARRRSLATYVIGDRRREKLFAGAHSDSEGLPATATTQARVMRCARRRDAARRGATRMTCMRGDEVRRDGVAARGWRHRWAH